MPPGCASHGRLVRTEGVRADGPRCGRFTSGYSLDHTWLQPHIGLQPRLHMVTATHRATSIAGPWPVGLVRGGTAMRSARSARSDRSGCRLCSLGRRLHHIRPQVESELERLLELLEVGEQVEAACGTRRLGAPPPRHHSTPQHATAQSCVAPNPSPGRCWLWAGAPHSGEGGRTRRASALRPPP